MFTALAFQSTTFNCIDHQGQPWLMGTEIARALSYSRADRIAEIYKRNASEFTEGMTCTRKLRVQDQHRDVRIFSLRGAHLLAMFARTPVAKDFRRWVLDILDRETAVPSAPTLTYQAMVGAITAYSQKHGRGATVAALQGFGAKNLPGVPESRWPELLAVLQCAPDRFAGLKMAEAYVKHNRFLLSFDRDGLMQLAEVPKDARLYTPQEVEAMMKEPPVSAEEVETRLEGILKATNVLRERVVPKALPELSFHDAAILTLRARYCHGDYKALARDLGIHESSAKKIVGRLALQKLDYARSDARQ